MWATVICLLAQAKDAAGKAPKGPGGLGGIFQNPLMLMGILLFAMIFLFWLPSQRRQKREREALQSGLEKNDEVQTIGGIIGTISAVNEQDDYVTLRLADNAKMKILKSAIAHNRTKTKAAQQPKETAESIKKA